MRSVLLVDDTGLFREAGEALLRRTHCTLLTGSTGSEALAIARREKPDLVFLDAQMSGMTGIDVCRVLKADPAFSHTPVIIACGDEKCEEEAMRAGASGLLSRPPEETDFFESVRKYLQVFPRDEARSAVGWSVTFWRDGIQYEGTIRDLSRGGLFVRTPVRLPIGARIEVSFDVPGDKPGRTVVAEAIVVRMGQEPDRGIGCRFFRLTSSARTHLEECLRLLELGEVTAR
ncbi:MAG: response regulator [Thermoanaerobaculia bacterium]